MDVLKNPPANGLRHMFVRSALQFGHQFTECLDSGAGRLLVFHDGGLSLTDYAIAPALRFGKGAFGHSVIGAPGIERAPDGICIGITHQFADKLLLPSQGAFCSHRRGREYGFPKPFIQRQFLQFPGRESNQALAQFLQQEVFAFSGCFAGLCLGHRLSYSA